MVGVETMKWAIQNGVVVPFIIYIAYHFWRGHIPAIKNRQEEQDGRLETIENVQIAQAQVTNDPDAEMTVEAVIEAHSDGETSPRDFIKGGNSLLRGGDGDNRARSTDD